MFWNPFAAFPLLGLFMLSRITTESISPEYHYYNQSLSWHDAQVFCRIKHGDLATVTSMEDAALLADVAGQSDAWIGLRLSGTVRWLWADGSGPLLRTYWQESEPNSMTGKEGCSETDDEGWNDVACTKLRSYACQSASSPPSYSSGPHKRTWASAQHNCRALGMNLPTVHQRAQNRDILTAANDDASWIGLFLDSWVWSDGNPSSFRHGLWGYSSVSYRCAVFRAKAMGRWYPERCDAKRPFVCQGGLKSRSMVIKLKMDSDGGLERSGAGVQLLKQLEVQLKSHGISDLTLNWRKAVHRQAEMNENSVAKSHGPDC